PGCARGGAASQLVLAHGPVVRIERLGELAAAIAARDEVQLPGRGRRHRRQQGCFAGHRDRGGRQPGPGIGVVRCIGAQVPPAQVGGRRRARGPWGGGGGGAAAWRGARGGGGGAPRAPPRGSAPARGSVGGGGGGGGGWGGGGGGGGAAVGAGGLEEVPCGD